MSDPKPCCGNCAFSRMYHGNLNCRINPALGGVVTVPKQDALGRMALAIETVGYWPIVPAEGWCAEHRQNLEKGGDA